jgi:hypothetical protein
MGIASARLQPKIFNQMIPATTCQQLRIAIPGSMSPLAIMRSSRLRSVFGAEPQSCLVEGCAGIVRWRDRHNHAFAP